MLGLYHGNRIVVVGHKRLIYAPRWLSPDYATEPVGRVTLYPSFIACALDRRPQRLCLWRTYALGDILMLLPIVRGLRRLLELQEPVRIVVQARHMESLRPMQGDEFLFLRKTQAFGDYGADLHYNLDSCLEADHRGGPESDLHRMELYGRALGVEVAPTMEGACCPRT